MKLRSALAVLLISPRFGSRTGLKGSCLGHAMTTAWMARLPCGSRSLRRCMSVSLMGSSQARIFAAKVLAVEQCNEAASSRSEAWRVGALSTHALIVRLALQTIGSATFVVAYLHFLANLESAFKSCQVVNHHSISGHALYKQS